MNSRAGFTRADLMAILAVGSLLLFVAAPAVGNTRSEAHAIGCLDNQRQLTRAWLTFGSDNNEILSGSPHGGEANNAAPWAGTGRFPWATGWLTWDSFPHNTNIQYLIDPRYAVLAPYVAKKTNIYRCPADGYISRVQQQTLRWPNRVRSYSMNALVGVSMAESGPLNPLYRKATKLSEMVTPPPAMVFVFLDEHADSINDPLFYPPSGSGNSLSWVDLPANYHEGGTAVSFADGRVELRSWTGPVRATRVTTAELVLPPGATSAQADLRYLYERTPRNNP